MSNGNVPASDLTLVEGVFLENATAVDYLAWRAAALRAGFIMRIALPGGAYRSYALQAAMRAAYIAHRYGAYNLSPPPSPIPAPAGYSRHGFGRAVDIANASGPGTFRNWVRGSAAQFNFHLWTTSDPNHFEHGNALTPAALDEHPVSGDPADTSIPLLPGDTVKFLKVMLNPDVSASHYVGYLYNDDGVLLEKEDVQTGWNGKQPFVPNPKYALLEKTYAAGLPIAAYTFSNEEFALFQSMVAAWPKPAGGTSLSIQPVLDAIAAGDAQVLAAIGQVDENTLATLGLKRV